MFIHCKCIDIILLLRLFQSQALSEIKCFSNVEFSFPRDRCQGAAGSGTSGARMIHEPRATAQGNGPRPHCRGGPARTKLPPSRIDPLLGRDKL